MNAVAVSAPAPAVSTRPTSRTLEDVTAEVRLRAGDEWALLYAQTTEEVGLHRGEPRCVGRRRTVLVTGGADDVEVASARVVTFDVPLPWEIAWLVDYCDGESADLYEVAWRLEALAERLEAGDHIHAFEWARLVTLDAVEVAEPFRGIGAGQVVAAAALHSARALEPGTLCAAIAGARTDTNRAEVTAAAAGLLSALGMRRELVRTGDAVFCAEWDDLEERFEYLLGL